MSEERVAHLMYCTDFENRKDEITKQLLEAAETAGFMALVDHGVTIEDIENQFAMSKAFFALPKEVKGRIPHDFRTNNGWEYYVGTCPLPPEESTHGARLTRRTGPTVPGSKDDRDRRPKRIVLAPASIPVAK